MILCYNHSLKVARELDWSGKANLYIFPYNLEIMMRNCYCESFTRFLCVVVETIELKS